MKSRLALRSRSTSRTSNLSSTGIHSLQVAISDISSMFGAPASSSMKVAIAAMCMWLLSAHCDSSQENFRHMLW
jgi:thiamine monophosphate kinase